MCAQVIVTMRSAAQAGLPPVLQGVYATLGTLQVRAVTVASCSTCRSFRLPLPPQFQGITVPPACVAGRSGPFSAQNLQFGFIVAVQVVAALLHAIYLPCCEGRDGVGSSAKRVAPAPTSQTPASGGGDRAAVQSLSRDSSEDEGGGAAKATAAVDMSGPCGWLRHPLLSLGRMGVMILLVALYATIANNVFTTLRCADVPMSVRTYLRTDMDGTTLARAGIGHPVPLLISCDDFYDNPGCRPVVASGVLDREITVSTLASDTSLVCYEGSHAIAVRLAWLLLVAYTLAFPPLVLLFVRRRMRRALRGAKLWEDFLLLRRIDAELRDAYVASTIGTARMWRRLRVALCWPAIRKAALGHADMLEAVSAILRRHAPADAPAGAVVQASAINVMTPVSPGRGRRRASRRSLSPLPPPRPAWVASTPPPPPSPASPGNRSTALHTSPLAAPQRRLSLSPTSPTAATTPSAQQHRHVRSPLSGASTAFAPGGSPGSPVVVAGTHPRVASLATGHSRVASQDSVVSRRASATSPAGGGAGTRRIFSPSDPRSRVHAYSPTTRRTSDASGVGDGEVLLSAAHSHASAPDATAHGGGDSGPGGATITAIGPPTPPPAAGATDIVPPPSSPTHMADRTDGAAAMLSVAPAGPVPTGDGAVTTATDAAPAPAAAVPPRSPASSVVMVSRWLGGGGEGCR